MLRTLENEISKCHNWREFITLASNAENTKIKGDLFELVTKRYLEYSPMYKAVLRNVWLQKDVPQKVREYIGLPTTDMGIDIIAETLEGEYWAIQCKYHGDSSRSLTWKEVSTFTSLAFGVCKNITFGLICTTGEKYVKILNQHDKLGICSSQTWETLDTPFFQSFKQNTSGSALTPLTPRPHQESAIEKSINFFKYNDRGKLIMPCGTGKSLTSFWIHEALSPSLSIVAVPSIALMRQTFLVWSREVAAQGLENDFRWLCVCSDESVTRSDDAVYNTQDLGIPSTTDVGVISKWLKRSSGKRSVLFTTYQSSKAICEAARNSSTRFDFAVFDEAHKTVGNRSSLFSLLLFDKNISIKKRLYMTATERRYVGTSSSIVSMDDESIYGKTIELLTFKNALLATPKIVSDYKVLTLFITKAEVQSLILNKSHIKVAGSDIDDIGAETLAAMIALEKATAAYPIKHTVSFHSSIKKAEAFKELAEKYSTQLDENSLKIEPYHVNGKQPASDRQRILNEFVASEKSLVTNARCLTEGVDVPSIDSVLFVDPKKSRVDIVQALGRALRPSEKKKFGYIIIPVLVDNINEIDDFSESEAFADLIVTLRALASNDERIIDYFKDASSNKTPSTTRHTIIDEIYSVIDTTEVNLAEFRDAITVRCWDSIIKLSYSDYERGKKFVHKLGLKDEDEWGYYCKGLLHNLPEKPINVPENPEQVYRGSWRGWGDWLGKDFSAFHPFTFEYAREQARGLGLSSKAGWDAYIKAKSPKNIPARPHVIYYQYWKDWDDWLGIKPEKGSFLPFAEARKLARKQGFKYPDEWIEYARAKSDSRVPRRPDLYYLGQWLGWINWLVTGIREKATAEATTDLDEQYLEFLEQREFARSLGLQSVKQWRKYRIGQLDNHPLVPEYVEPSPDIRWSTYWIGWDDWLRRPIGITENKHTSVSNRAGQYGQYLIYDTARQYVQTLGLKSKKEWRNYCDGRMPNLPQKPHDIPTNPRRVYSSEWKNWGDWLGKQWVGQLNQLSSLQKPKQSELVPFNLARIYARKLNVRSVEEWTTYAFSGSRPDYIPGRPDLAYPLEWISWDDWLMGSNK